MTISQADICRRVKFARNNPEFRKLVIENTLPTNYQTTAWLLAKTEDDLLKKTWVHGVAIGASDHRDHAIVRPVIFLENDDAKHRNEAKDVFQKSLERQQLASNDRDRALDTLDFVVTGRIISRLRRPPFLQRTSLFSRKFLRLRTGPTEQPDRPLVGGLKGGARNGAKGTLGVCCYGKDSTKLEYVLSNNHVLARLNKGKIGSDIDQVYGTKSEIAVTIGRLAGFVRIEFEQRALTSVNYVEAAIAQRNDKTDLDEKIDRIGVLNCCDYAPAIGTEVKKVGADTKLTCGAITHVGATIKVHRNREDLLFRHQIITDTETDFGDSGSLLVSKLDNHPIGLIFAKDTKQGHTYASSILLVEAFLEIRIWQNGASLPDLGLPA